MSKVAAFLGANSGPILGVGVFAVGALGAGAYLGLLAPEGTQQQAVPTEVALPAPDVPPTEETNVEPIVVAPTISEPAPATETVVVQEPEVEPMPEPVIEDTVGIEPEPEAETAVLLPRTPSIDEVRSEADGLTIIAGRGEPGADIILFVDNIENTSVQVGNDSAFAIVTFIDVSPNATVLSVIQRVGDVELVASDIILAPRIFVQADPVPSTDISEKEPIGEDVAAVSAETAAPTNAADDETENVSEAADAKAAALVDPIAPNPSGVEPEIAALVDPISPNPDGTVQVATDLEPETGNEVVATVVEQPAIEDPAAQDPAQDTTPQVAILKSDEDGVQIINRSSAPEVMSNVEIDTISYSDEGDVLLSGRAQEEAATVRVYLNNAPVTVLEVDTTGRWRGDLPDVDTGVYTLRVDEVDAEGAVTSRVETPFKREAPEVLAAAGGTEDAPAKAITVQTGATLWAIARDRYGDGTLFVRIFEANADSIKDADLIYPGQVFDLPE